MVSKRLLPNRSNLPKIVCTDASPSILDSLRTVFPYSLILLDEWHLNERQYINVCATLRKKKEGGRFKEMIRDLFSLRRSRTV